ncbi:hypothetical protein [Streptomyces atratus]
MRTGLLDRGRRIGRNDVGLGERAAAEFAHGPVLPFDRFGDARVDALRGRDGLVGGERGSVKGARVTLADEAADGRPLKSWPSA